MFVSLRLGLGFGVGVGGSRGRVEKGLGYLTLDYDNWNNDYTQTNLRLSFSPPLCSEVKATYKTAQRCPLYMSMSYTWESPLLQGTKSS